jgi:hypothetical protein
VAPKGCWFSTNKNKLPRTVNIPPFPTFNRSYGFPAFSLTLLLALASSTTRGNTPPEATADLLLTATGSNLSLDHLLLTGTVALRFQSSANRRYQFEYRDNLLPGDWRAMGPPLMATATKPQSTTLQPKTAVSTDCG